ncbi:MAG: type VI secretion system contractile sheath protein TssC [Chitinophagales bacterium]
MSEKELEGQPQEARVQEGEKKSSRDLAEISQGLANFGGFAVLETTVEGAKNMNPEKRARKKIFLTETSYKSERELLKARINLWLKVLGSGGEITEMIDKCAENSDKAEKLLNKNLKKITDDIKNLERSYRSVAFFFKGAGTDKVKNLTVVNASMDQVTDLDTPLVFDKVYNEFRDKFDRLDLMNNYSLMAIPGYMKNKQVIDKWGKMAHDSKVMLVTDFRNLESPDDVMELFEDEKLTGADEFKANIIMGCNWLVGRERHENLGEEETVYVPSAGAMVGNIYKTKMSQVAAGKKYGVLNEVSGVKFDMRANEIAAIEKLGLVPVVKEYGQVMAFSAKTLFNGNNIGKQTYSVVRVFDWVTKSLIDYLNRVLFQNIDTNMKVDVRREIAKFLDSNQGPGKLIEKFKILECEVDKKKRDKVNIKLHIVPYFPAKNFAIKLDGMKGDDPSNPNWTADFEEEN